MAYRDKKISRTYPAIGAFRDSTQLENSHSNNYLHEPHGGFYTQKEIKEIIRYAEHLHIRVIPEIEMPGHAGAAIAAYTWLGCTGKRISVPCKFGVNYDILDVTNPKVYSFIENILDEIIALFHLPSFTSGAMKSNTTNGKPLRPLRNIWRKTKSKILLNFRSTSSIKYLACSARKVNE